MKVIKFGSSHCGPCKVMENNMKDWNRCELQYADIDTDDGFDLSMKYNIRSTPTLVLLSDNGEELCRQIGGVTPWQIDAYLDDLKK